MPLLRIWLPVRSTILSLIPGKIEAIEMYWVHVLIMCKANGRTETGSKYRKRSASTLVKVVLELWLSKCVGERTCVFFTTPLPTPPS